MVIQVEKMEKNYGTFRLNCSLEVKEGCVTGLIGQNGAGKSTTFKGILGLLHTDGGSVRVMGKDVEKLTQEEKGLMGVVLPGSVFSKMLNIKDTAKIMEGLYQSFEPEKFLAKCRSFGLPDKKPMKEFSTGMLAKLKILMALSHETRLLILDEPTAGLDVVARDEILEILREYMEDEKHSILISSHISKDLEGFCDDLYMIHNGKIMLHEETDVLLSEYGMLKVDEKKYQALEKKYLMRVKKEGFGYCCLTNQKQFYLDNYPGIVVEKGSIDDVLTMTIKGETL